MHVDAIHLRLAFSLSFAALSACGGKVESSVADSGFDPPASVARDSGSPVTGFSDAATSSDFDGSPGFPPVEYGPNDLQPACGSRPGFSCDCRGENCPPGAGNALGDLARDCALLGSGSVCGFVYVDFDSSGCATALRMDQPNGAFVACLTKQLDSARWACATSTNLPSGEAQAYVDCTTRGH